MVEDQRQGIAAEEELEQRSRIYARNPEGHLGVYTVWSSPTNFYHVGRRRPCLVILLEGGADADDERILVGSFRGECVIVHDEYVVIGGVADPDTPAIDVL